MTDVVRICTTCKEPKLLNQFSRKVKHSSGFNPQCKSCCRKAIDLWTDKIKARNAAIDARLPVSKQCFICKETKPNLEFGRDIRSADGMPSYCRACYRSKDIKQASRILRPAMRREALLANPKVFKASQMIRNAKHRAKVAGLPFDINEDYVVKICGNECPALGIPLDYMSNRLMPNSPALDKFKGDLGYVEGNVAVISHLANTIKNSATSRQVIAVAKWMATVEGLYRPKPTLTLVQKAS